MSMITARTAVPTYTETLPCEDGSAPKARDFVLTALSAWGISGSPVEEAVLLVASELATNAIKHSRHETFQIRISCADAEVIKVLVADGSQTVPILNEPADDSESGRGLNLVEALSVRWGHEREARGKSVWADISAVADPWCALATPEGAA